MRESVYLFKSLHKRDNPLKETRRLVRNWIDYVIFLHQVPENLSYQLKEEILLFFELHLKSKLKEEEGQEELTRTEPQ